MLNPLLQCVCASASSEGQKLFGTTSETTSERRPDARTTPQPCAAPQGSAWPPFQEKGTWRIIPGSKWLVTSIYKLFRPLTRGIASFRELTNHGQESAPPATPAQKGKSCLERRLKRCQTDVQMQGQPLQPCIAPRALCGHPSGRAEILQCALHDACADKNFFTKTPPHQHKNTTTGSQKHHHITPPQEYHHTTTKTPPHHHHKNTTKAPPSQKTPPHHHKNTTTTTTNLLWGLNPWPPASWVGVMPTELNCPCSEGQRGPWSHSEVPKKRCGIETRRRISRKPKVTC